MSKREARAFEEKRPVVDVLAPSRDRWRISFVRASDRKILTEWRESNNKTLWQKAVTVLENAKKVEVTVLNRTSGSFL
jgi:hypothetical protein